MGAERRFFFDSFLMCFCMSIMESRVSGFFFRFHRRWLSSLILLIVHLWRGTRRDERDYRMCSSRLRHAGLLHHAGVQPQKDETGAETGQWVNDDNLISRRSK